MPHKAELLEIGTAAHTTRFYRKFLQCRYDTICRPSNLGGPPQQWAIEAGSENHWEIDLNCLERYANMLAEMPSSTYDVVVCCEVIEHLTRAPRELIKFALSKLKPTGFLYLTTPNFLTPANIRRIHVGRNPNAEFDRYYDNIDAHQHFREYTPRELVDEVVGAGGVAREVIFSNCWDYPRFSDVQELMFRSNLVMVINRQEA